MDEDDGRFRLHRLLGDFIWQEALDPTAQADVIRALVACGDTAMIGALNGTALSAVIPHMVHVAGRAVMGVGMEQADALCDAAEVLLQRAVDLGDAGLALHGAQLWCAHALEIRDQPRTSRRLANTAGLLEASERALAIWERTVGLDHPVTATSLNNLGFLLWARSDLADARPMFERALATFERALGSDHHRVAISINNLAAVVRDQGDPAAARPLFERALAIRERVLGPDHPDTVATRRALAELAADGDGAADGG